MGRHDFPGGSVRILMCYYALNPRCNVLITPVFTRRFAATMRDIAFFMQFATCKSARRASSHQNMLMNVWLQASRDMAYLCCEVKQSVSILACRYYTRAVFRSVDFMMDWSCKYCPTGLQVDNNCFPVFQHATDAYLKTAAMQWRSHDYTSGSKRSMRDFK